MPLTQTILEVFKTQLSTHKLSPWDHRCPHHSNRTLVVSQYDIALVLCALDFGSFHQRWWCLFSVEHKMLLSTSEVWEWQTRPPTAKVHLTLLVTWRRLTRTLNLQQSWKGNDNHLVAANRLRPIIQIKRRTVCYYGIWSILNDDKELDRYGHPKCIQYPLALSLFESSPNPHSRHQPTAPPPSPCHRPSSLHLFLSHFNAENIRLQSLCEFASFEPKQQTVWTLQRLQKWTEHIQWHDVHSQRRSDQNTQRFHSLSRRQTISYFPFSAVIRFEKICRNFNGKGYGKRVESATGNAFDLWSDWRWCRRLK